MRDYDTDEKMQKLDNEYNVTLPQIFSLYTSELKRIGPMSDGGYWVEQNSIENSDHLLSFGMNDDWRFEKEIEKLSGNQIDVYDGSTSQKLFRNNIIKEALKIFRVRSTLKAIQTYIDYSIFFNKKNVVHHRRYVGLNFENHRDKWSSLEAIMKTYNSSSRILIKCDIEGGEYRLLDDLLRYNQLLTGLIIEFHDLDIMMDKVTQFISDFPLKLVAVNVNNYGPMKNNTPTVIECTFSSNYLKTKIDGIQQIKNDPDGFMPVLSIKYDH